MGKEHCGLVVSAPTWDGTGCEFNSWQCPDIYPMFIEPTITWVPSRFTYGLTQQMCWKKTNIVCSLFDVTYCQRKKASNVKVCNVLMFSLYVRCAEFEPTTIVHMRYGLIFIQIQESVEWPAGQQSVLCKTKWRRTMVPGGQLRQRSD